MTITSTGDGKCKHRCPCQVPHLHRAGLGALTQHDLEVYGGTILFLAVGLIRRGFGVPGGQPNRGPRCKGSPHQQRQLALKVRINLLLASGLPEQLYCLVIVIGHGGHARSRGSIICSSPRV